MSRDFFFVIGLAKLILCKVTFLTCFKLPIIFLNYYLNMSISKYVKYALKYNEKKN